METVIRPLKTLDVGRLVSIEKAAYPYPWTRGIFADCIRVGYPGFGLLVQKRLVGYVILNFWADESHLLNLCVHPHWQGKGYGRTLLEFGIQHVQNLGCRIMFLEVRPSNPAAIRLYKQFGFSVIGRRPGYYQADDGREDAVVMRLNLSQSDHGDAAATGV